VRFVQSRNRSSLVVRDSLLLVGLVAPDVLSPLLGPTFLNRTNLNPRSDVLPRFEDAFSKGEVAWTLVA